MIDRKQTEGTMQTLDEELDSFSEWEENFALRKFLLARIDKYTHRLTEKISVAERFYIEEMLRAMRYLVDDISSELF